MRFQFSQSSRGMGVFLSKKSWGIDEYWRVDSCLGLFACSRPATALIIPSRFVEVIDQLGIKHASSV
ncbi:hypothetical protein APB71_33935, partial [Pseudomonas aeruginosa]